MSKRSRRYHAPSQKAELLRQHHVDKVPISQLCNHNQLQPSVFYTLQRHLWEHVTLSQFHGHHSNPSWGMRDHDAKTHPIEIRPTAS